MKQKLVAAIYARKSVILKKGDTLNIQEDKCRENLKLRYKYDYDLTIKCFTDEKTGKDMDREEMQSMIEQIKEGKVQVVCAYKLDRFGRNAIELVNFIELLKKYNVKLHCVDDQINYDPTDDNDVMTKLMIVLLSVLAEMERNNIRQRVIVTVYSLARKGFWLGGTAPYGFVSVRVPNEGIIDDVGAKSICILNPYAEEIQVVKYMYATYKDEDVSYSELANRCNDLGYEPRFASMFDQHTIQGMLMNLVYVKAAPQIYDWLISKGYSVENIPARDKFDGKHALLTYGKTLRGEEADNNIEAENKNRKDVKDWIVAIAPHEGVIEANDWLVVQNKIERNKGSKSKKNTKHNNVLITSDMFRCGCCGGVISSFNRKSRTDDNVLYPHYRCENKRKRRGKLCDVDNLPATDVDEKIIDLIFEKRDEIASSVEYIKRNLMPARKEYVKKNIIPKLEKEIKVQLKKIDGFLENMSSGKLNDNVLEMVNNKIEECNVKIKELEERIAEEDNKMLSMDKNHQNLDLLIDKFFSLDKTDFMKLPMKDKRNLVRLLIKEVVWDGENVHVYFKTPDSVCGGDTTDSLSINTALTNVDMVKRLFLMSCQILFLPPRELLPLKTLLNSSFIYRIL